MRTRLLASAGLAAALALPALGLPSVAPAGAADPLTDAVAWLESQQQADGGFEVAQFPGFETPDAVLALAMAGQSEAGWSASEALAAVQAVQTQGGKDPLDSVDDWVDGVQGGDGSAAAKAQQAAKVIALVAVPLGLQVTDFDPSGDSDLPVDLLAALQDGAGDGSYSALPFAGRAYALWALAAADAPVPPALVQGIESAQGGNGSWNYQGDPQVPGFDVDTTAVTAIALAVAGEVGGNVQKAAAALGLQQTWDGEWAGEFDDGNPNSTSQVMLLAATLGSDPESTCWRDDADGRATGIPYPSPSRSIVRRQTPEGRITSPNDGWGINTFATAQAIQGLAASERAWPYVAGQCAAPAVGAERRLVNAHYGDLLDRFSDEPGAAYWVDQLQGGASRALVAKRLVGTPEYGRRVIDRIVRTYLDRPATSQEMAQAGPSITDGRRLVLIGSLLGGAEYYTSTANPGSDPTPGGWVDAVYLDVFGRPADAGGKAYVLQQLEDGVPREVIGRRLVTSTESLRRIVAGFYQDLLRRNPDVPGRDHWVGELQRGRSPEGLVTLIAGSGEYAAKTAPPA